MRTRRRLAALAAAGTLALGVAACSDDDGDVDEIEQDVEDGVDDVEDEVDEGVDDVEDEVDGESESD